LNKAIEKKLDFMIKKTKQDISALWQQNYCLQKREISAPIA
jgi:hypothetical protein